MCVLVQARTRRSSWHASWKSDCSIFVLKALIAASLFKCGAGEDEAEQLACIMEVMGLPPNHLLSTATRRKLFFDSNNSPRPTVNSQNRTHTPGKDGCGHSFWIQPTLDSQKHTHTHTHIWSP